MLKLMKFLQKSVGAIIIVVLLLILQAYTDLSLPTYTSEIVNIGIMRNGIATSVPEVLRGTELDRLSLFMSQEEKDTALPHFNLMTKDNYSADQWADYLKKYPLLETEKLYLFDGENIDQVADALALPSTIVFLLEGTEDTSVQMQQPDAKLNMIQERDSWGLIYEYQETMAENESIQYNSGGTVTTSDGKTILFSTEFSMARSYYEQNRVNIRLGNAVMVDPLMMVMRGGTSALSRDKASFDLDSDDSVEELAFATDGSGFLEPDRNGGGIINDGSELFGSRSGAGFKELRVFDMDRNGWIDESDDVFSRLSLLSLSGNGEKTLVKLADVGVGAIYLDEIGTPFEFEEETDTFGAMKSSSVFLREGGSAGTIHHVDLSL